MGHGHGPIWQCGMWYYMHTVGILSLSYSRPKSVIRIDPILFMDGQCKKSSPLVCMLNIEPAWVGGGGAVTILPSRAGSWCLGWPHRPIRHPHPNGFLGHDGRDLLCDAVRFDLVRENAVIEPAFDFRHEHLPCTAVNCNVDSNHWRNSPNQACDGAMGTFDNGPHRSEQNVSDKRRGVLRNSQICYKHLQIGWT